MDRSEVWDDGTTHEHSASFNEKKYSDYPWANRTMAMIRNSLTVVPFSGVGQDAVIIEDAM